MTYRISHNEENHRAATKYPTLDEWFSQRIMTSEQRKIAVEKQALKDALSKMGYEPNRKGLRKYYKTKEWQEFRERYFKYRASLKQVMECDCCGTNNISLQLHHTTYISFGTRDLQELVSIVLVCDKCHKGIHDIATQHKIAISEATQIMMGDDTEYASKVLQEAEDKRLYAVQARKEAKERRERDKRDFGEFHRPSEGPARRDRFIHQASIIWKGKVAPHIWQQAVDEISKILGVKRLTAKAIAEYMKKNGWTNNKVYRYYKDPDGYTEQTPKKTNTKHMTRAQFLGKAAALLRKNTKQDTRKRIKAEFCSLMGVSKYTDRALTQYMERQGWIKNKIYRKLSHYVPRKKKTKPIEVRYK